MGLRGTHRTIPTVPLWEKQAEEMDMPRWTVRFLKVPSHVHLLGNIQAVLLANSGRLRSNLNHTSTIHAEL